MHVRERNQEPGDKEEEAYHVALHCIALHPT